MTNVALNGKSDTGNLHVRIDEGGIASEKPRRGSLLFAALGILSLVAVARAADCWWIGTEATDPSLKSGWYSSRIPGTGDNAIVNDGPTKSMKITTGTFDWGNFYIGGNQKRTDNKVTMAGGSVNVSSYFYIGQGAGSGGTFQMDGGTLTSAGDINFGYAANSRATVNVTDGEIVANARLIVGDNASSLATLNLSGGTVTCAKDCYIGRPASAPGTVNVTGGTLVMSAGKTLAVGVRGDGVLNVSGPTAVIDFRKAHLYTAADRSWVSAKVGSGKITLSNGATLKDFDRFYMFGPDCSFTCDGGVLQLSANRSLSVFNTSYYASTAVYVGNGGITFVTDNTGSAAETVIDVGTPLFAAPDATSGGFVKKGPGILRLAKGNTYLAGPVDIQQGKVIANAPNALPYTTLALAEGAELELGGGWSPAQVAAIKALATVKGRVTHTLVVDEDVTIEENLTAEDVGTKIANPKTGSAVLTLTGTNDFGGAFRVNEGTLAADFGQGLAWTDRLTLGADAAFNTYKPALFAPLNGQVTNAVGSAGGEISFGSNTEAGFAAVVPTTVNLFNDARMLTANAELPRKLVFNTTTLTNDIHFSNPINLHGNPANFDLTVEGGHAYLSAIDSYLGSEKSTAEGTGTLAKKGAGTLHMPSTSTIYYLYGQGGHLDFPADGTYDFGYLQGNNADSLTTFGAGSKVTTRSLVSSTWSTMVFNEGCEVTISNGATFEKGGTAIFSNATVTVTSGDVVTKKSDSSSGGTMIVKGGTFKNTGSGWMQAQDGGGYIFDGCTAKVNPYFIAGRTSSKSHPTSTSIIRGGAQMTFSNLYIMHGNLEIHDEGTLVKASLFAHGDADTKSSASGPGSFLMTGGRVEVSGDINVGRRSGSVGLFRLEGGTMWLSSGKSIVVGNAGDGTFEVAGGLVDASVADGIALMPFWLSVDDAYKKTERGLLRLLGGEVKAQKIYGKSGKDTTVEFDGGKFTLVNGTYATMFDNVANLRMGENGGEIDTGANDFTAFKQFVALTNQTPTAVSGAVYNTAKAFVKSGSGKLTLKGANTYTCGSEVKTGTLALASGASLPSDQFVRLSGGTLDLGGSATQKATALLGTGGMLANGTLTLTDGIFPGGYETVGAMTVTLDNAKIVGTVKIDYDETTKTCDKLVLSEGADVSGLTFDLANLPAKMPKGVARFDILTGSGLVGTPTIVNKPSRLHVSVTALGIRVTDMGFSIMIR